LHGAGASRRRRCSSPCVMHGRPAQSSGHLRASGAVDWPGQGVRSIVDKKISGLTGLIRAARSACQGTAPGRRPERVDGGRQSGISATGRTRGCCPAWNHRTDRAGTKIWTLEALPSSIVIIGADASAWVRHRVPFVPRRVTVIGRSRIVRWRTRTSRGRRPRVPQTRGHHHRRAKVRRFATWGPVEVTFERTAAGRR
jgi:hypothetical protein